MEGTLAAPTRKSQAWNLLAASYWFATSFKWFILLTGLLASKVQNLVPGGEASTTWGLIVAIGAAEGLIGPALFGVLSDRCLSRFGRRRPFIGMGAALTACAVMFAGFAESIPMLIGAYLLLQISDDVGQGAYQAVIPEHVPEEDRGKASGAMGLMQLMAQIGAAVVGMLFAETPMILFGTIAGVNILCGLIVLCVVKETPMTTKPPSVTAGELAKQWIEPWRIPDFVMVWFTRLLNAIGFYLVYLYLKFYLEASVKVFKIGPLELPDAFRAMIVIALIISLLGAIGAMVFGRRADKIGRKSTVRIAGWLMFLALIPFALVPSYPVIVGVSCVFGLGYGAYLSADWALASDIMPNQSDFARDMGMWSMSVPLGQMLSGLAGGLVDALNRVGEGLGYRAVFLIGAGFFILSTELVRRIKGST